MPSLAEWANLTRVLDEKATSQSELPRLLRLSSRAVRSGVANASRKGWVTVGTNRTVQLTLAGSEAAARWESVREAAEIEWRESIGADVMLRLRASLDSFVTRLPLELSHYPAGYGMADERITGGNGKDWKPVQRDACDTVARLPISALISEALVAFSMAYEEKSGVALSLSAMVLRVIPAEGRLAKELGFSVGVSALRRHGFLRSTTSAKGPMMHLTDIGRRISDAYDDLLHDVEADWRASLGDEIFTDLHAALEGVAENSRLSVRDCPTK